jgi:signal transduction histidine kinase
MDPHDFGEVMGNLLDNARKWAQSRVSVAAEENAGKVRIVVEDDGPGFAEADGGRRPARGLPAQSDPSSTGLGLGIVEDILAEYGTGVQFQANGRCRVSFEVPLCQSIPSVPGANGEARRGTISQH